VLSRRDFLTSSTLFALAPTVPAFLAQTARAAKPQRDGRVLVVVELNGGNDGINTVVPFTDEGYAKHRKLLRLPTDELIKVNDKLGLHPSMAAAGKLLDAGQLAIVQGVGYPNPNRSHFESMAIWHTARLDPRERGDLGWLGRAFDDWIPPTGGVPSSVFIGGGQLPTALCGRRSITSSLTRPEDFVLTPELKPNPAIELSAKDNLTAFLQRSALDAYTTADGMADILPAGDNGDRYPPTELAKQMQLIVRLIKGAVGTRVFYTLHYGYDTHSAQIGTHAALLSELTGALKAFMDDLATAKLAERVAVLIFSEFGRTVSENGSGGTDHGTAGPVFLAGPGVKGGLVGAMPSLLDLDPQFGDLRRSLDFRQIYATVLQKWLGMQANAALGGTFERLPLFRN
jgi:uncharacterized protein (DUF1501 family)